MTRVVRASVLAGAFVFLASIGPAVAPGPSDEALQMLDPIGQASALCGRGAFDTLRQRLRLVSLSSAAQAATQGFMPLYPGLEGLSFPVATLSDQARRYFQQGMMLSYGFNHAAAIRSFREAQRLDPACALCWWGEALAQGPNINAPMDPEALKETLAALGKAQALRAKAPPVEQALIDALGHRYSDSPSADRAAMDIAYARAMMTVAAQYPELDDVALLTAEALMDTRPWDYWEADRRTPKADIGTAVRLVETVIARNPGHPQASHLYIHLMENNADPSRAEAAAERLARNPVAGSGHLVHMPAHIYYRLGRFRDSINSNIVAARADEAYIKASGDAGLVRYGYYPHNVHFIVTSAQMAGDMNTAIREARRLDRIVSSDVAVKFSWVQAINAAPYLAYAQFGSPRQILALDPPDPRLPYVAGMRHYARAVAHAQRRDRKAFDTEIAALHSIRTTADFETNIAQGMPAPDLLALAEMTARGRFAFASGNYADAVRLYREATEIEDKIPYMEPPYWYYPVHQSLGAALYRAGDYAGAKQAFRETLVRSPANGWALYGLAASERALGNRLEAAAADSALKRAWLGNRNWLKIDRL